MTVGKTLFYISITILSDWPSDRVISPQCGIFCGWWPTDNLTSALFPVSGGDLAQLVERRTGTPLSQVRFPGAAMDFSPRVNFQCRLSYGVRTPSSATACLSICTHVKDPVVHVRVRWIMETLKHPACTGVG